MPSRVNEYKINILIVHQHGANMTGLPPQNHVVTAGARSEPARPGSGPTAPPGAAPARRAREGPRALRN